MGLNIYVRQSDKEYLDTLPKGVTASSIIHFAVNLLMMNEKQFDKWVQTDPRGKKVADVFIKKLRQWMK